MQYRLRRPMLGVAAALGLMACSGRVSKQDSDDREPMGTAGRGGDGSVGNDASSGGGTPITSNMGGAGQMAPCKITASGLPLKQLSNTEFRNTIRDLLGAEVPAGFTLQASASQVLVEQLQQMSETLAPKVVAKGKAFTGCDGTATLECAGTFVRTFGARALRRPLTEAEVSSYLRLWQAEDNAQTGFETVVAAMLQSPHLLYRPVFGANGKLTPWELASRLSYLFVQSMPDSELMAAAGAGRLGTPTDVEAQAQRLMGSKGFKAVLADFHGQWLTYAAVEDEVRSPELFPDFTDDVALAMKQETNSLLEELFLAKGGYVKGLLLSDHTFANATLAKFYGLSGPKGDTFERLALPPHRRGAITSGAIMAANASATAPDPIHRGLLVRTKLLCDELPAPPKDLDITLPAPNPGETSRERFERHAATPACAGCHQLINPVGFAFEAFDAVGRFRTQDAGKPINTQGTLAGTDVEGAFVDANDLMKKLSASQQVSQCVARRFLMFTLSRDLVEADSCTTTQAERLFADNKEDPKDLIARIVQSDAFTHVGAAQ